MRNLWRITEMARAVALVTLLGMLSPGLARADSGLATWYGPGFQGNTMYNGQRFDMYDPTTTACNIFPLGTWLKVTNPANGRSVIVQVRDRGAFRHALDLSYAAFKLIADPALMEIPVTYQVVSGPAGSPLPARARPSSRGSRPSASTQYVVQPGDTLLGIAAQTGLDAASLAAWNGLADPNRLVAGQVLRLTPAASPTTPLPLSAHSHVVQSGETLFGIAQQFGVTVDQLVAANSLTDPNQLAIGQTLVIPNTSGASPLKTYTVQPGDTLSTIADSFGVDLNQLISANQIADPSLIQPGTQLVIPGR